ncbi:hypothetical protein X975_18927, partial [Stegodyphus mimosarum]
LVQRICIVRFFGCCFQSAAISTLGVQCGKETFKSVSNFQRKQENAVTILLGNLILIVIVYLVAPDDMCLHIKDKLTAILINKFRKIKK